MRRYLSTLHKKHPKIYEEPSARVILFIWRAKTVYCSKETKSLRRDVHNLYFIYRKTVDPNSVITSNVVCRVPQLPGKFLVQFISLSFSMKVLENGYAECIWNSIFFDREKIESIFQYFMMNKKRVYGTNS